MTRDPSKVACRTIFATTGPQSGKTSSEFHFRFTGGGSPSSLNYVDVANAVNIFWNGVSGGAGTPAWYLGPQIYRGSNATETAVYALDLADPHHYYGSPVQTSFFTLNPMATGATALPNEVAMTVSYRANYGSDPEHSGNTRPRASDRGRIYVGPLHNGVIAEVTAPNGTKFATIQSAVITGMLNSLSSLQTNALASSWQLSVWSRKEALFKDVADKAMNNDFDTSRRRSVAVNLQTWVPI